MIGKPPRIAFVVGQLEVNRFLHSDGNRASVIPDSAGLLPKDPAAAMDLLANPMTGAAALNAESALSRLLTRAPKACTRMA